MKQEKCFAPVSRTIVLTALIFFACFTFVGAQVIPRGCVAGFTSQDGTVNLAAAIPAGIGFQLTVNEFVPVNSFITINPGGTNQQGGAHLSFYRITAVSGTSAPYTLSFGGDVMLAHQAGEPVQFELREYEVSWGYQNLSSNSVTIPRGVSGGNYFSPGPFTYTNQPSTFLPGIHENVFSFKFVLQRGPSVTWFLNGSETTVDFNKPVRCATITYQGRLSDGNAAANGQYDLSFTVFDALTDGAAQSGIVKVENAQVTNGVFTVQLNFGSALADILKANFLEIAVRPGASGGTDPFTVLTPRQPITKVPSSVHADMATNTTNAVNATNAANAEQLGNVAANQYVLTTDPRLSATNNTNFIQNSTTQQTANFNINGNGTIGGSLTVGGTLNAAFGQNVTTAFGATRLQIDTATTAYTLVPELTQTVNVPANSSLFISTDGGVQSTGTAANSYSVIDVAIFVDGALVRQRRIVIVNNPLPSSVENWSLNTGQTLAAGSHTIEVRVRNGGVAGSTSAVVGGDSLLNGQLTVAVIKK